ncbi:cbb3-type cytochrome oxidase subunit 3 [Basilea psittacipulmonis]|uniref:Uncharacterized protein n=1 Tax=Basilea psittacipulmonis DSM 24701 TaxID=1072685 RepID=A0A077DDY0_9BURK|nr:CcoQ/FixQ family Cbb3-type cytochrome c oxidase assembly chaperone [Basilea psittacipulmonis]AIL32341.1 hypothetical protein IX83_02520 [Basilea psittacipulmonis DSM 24701]
MENGVFGIDWGLLNGISIVLSLLVFFGIVAFAWSKGRSKDIERASQLPFDLPDEAETQHKGVKE